MDSPVDQVWHRVVLVTGSITVFLVEPFFVNLCHILVIIELHVMDNTYITVYTYTYTHF